MEKEVLSNQTRAVISQLIELVPSAFGLQSLIWQNSIESANEQIAQLYQQVYETFTSNNIEFDHSWVIKRNTI